MFSHPSGEDGEWKTYPIRNISHTFRKESKSGEFIVFYGDQAKQNLAEFRLQMLYGPKEKLQIFEIVDKGWGDDHYFDRGEFVRD